MHDTAAKLERVRDYLKLHALDGAVFRTRANFAWLTGGGDAHVVSQDEGASCALVVTAREALLLADAIEAPRFEAEEPIAAFTVERRPWMQGLNEALAERIGDDRFATDDPAATGLAPLAADFLELRGPLSDAATDQFRRLGRDCSGVVETVAAQIMIGDSGLQIEAELARQLLARGIQPHVLLVGFDERVERYRHPIPKADRLERHAMLVICGKRHGLIASLTRMVHFGLPSEDLLARHDAVCRVEVAMWTFTVPGARYGAALEAGIAQYEQEGFAEEWTLHHQGGPTGYAARDYLVTPGESRVVQDRQAVAWNPSIAGTKAEDTFVVRGNSREVLTAASDAWPMVDVHAPGGGQFQRPGILVR